MRKIAPLGGNATNFQRSEAKREIPIEIFLLERLDQLSRVNVITESRELMTPAHGIP